MTEDATHIGAYDVLPAPNTIYWWDLIASPTTGKLSAALAKAQGEFPRIEKAKTAKVRGQTKAGKAYDYTYAYADLADIVAACAPVLARHELAITQITVPLLHYLDALRDTPKPESPGTHVLVTRLTHNSGEWMQGFLFVPWNRLNDPQEIGANLTYMRRYGYASMIGVQAEEDTDTSQRADPTPAAAKAAPKTGAAKSRRADSTDGAKGMISVGQAKRANGVAFEASQKFDGSIHGLEIIQHLLSAAGLPVLTGGTGGDAMAKHLSETISKDRYDNFISAIEKWEPPVSEETDEPPAEEQPPMLDEHGVPVVDGKSVF